MEVDAPGHPDQPLLTQADIDRDAPVPPKLAAGASDEEKAAREHLMKLRRKLQERLRQQSRDQAGSERARPSNDDASSRRAAQRALKAPSVALAAVESAAIPITLEREGPLHKMLEQAQAQVDKLNDLPCDANDKEYADWQFNHALLLFMWKKCQSLELSLGEHGPPMDAMLPFPKGDETKEVRDKSVALYAEILPLWMEARGKYVLTALDAHYGIEREAPELEDGTLV